MDGTYKAVTGARESLDISGMIGRVAQCQAKTVDGGIDAALEIDEGILRPKPAAQFIARNHVAWILEQRTKHLPGLGLKADTNALLAQLSGLQIHLKRSELDELRHVSGFRILFGR